MSSSGDLEKGYHVVDLCLQKEPLELDAEVWALMDNHDSKYSLVVRAIDDEPIELSGPSLRRMVDTKMVAIHPASYRLVYRND